MVSSFIVLLMLLGLVGLRTLKINRTFVPFLSPILNQLGLQTIYIQEKSDGIYEQITNISQYNGVRTEEYLEGTIVDLTTISGEVASLEVKGDYGTQIINLRPSTPELVLTQDMEKVDENYLQKDMRIRVYLDGKTEGKFTSHKIVIL